MDWSSNHCKQHIVSFGPLCCLWPELAQKLLQQANYATHTHTFSLVKGHIDYVSACKTIKVNR